MVFAPPPKPVEARIWVTLRQREATAQAQLADALDVASSAAETLSGSTETGLSS